MTEGAEGHKKKLVISICTYQRPTDLRKLLETLKTLTIPDDLNVSMRIIDNDTTPSALSVFEDYKDKLPVPITHVHEPEPGLTSARNRALDAAKGQDLLAFVDDDETVDPNWLLELWRVHQANDAQFTQGPVGYRVEAKHDSWWVEGGFFKQNLYEDGATIKEAWTNNVLIDLNFVRLHGIRFDETVRFIGGEDTLFFQDLVRAGAKGAFSAHAMVYEMQPPERLSWTWGIKRHYRYGVTRALCVLLRQTRLKAVAHGLVRGTAMLAVGILKLPMALIRGKRGLAESLSYIARGFGVLSGLIGLRHDAYGRE